MLLMLEKLLSSLAGWNVLVCSGEGDVCDVVISSDILVELLTFENVWNSNGEAEGKAIGSNQR